MPMWFWPHACVRCLYLYKPTVWNTNSSRIYARMRKLVCPGLSRTHRHEPCQGPNTKLGQVYDAGVSDTVVSGLVDELRNEGDERFTELPPTAQVCISVAPCAPQQWSPPLARYEALYVDVHLDVTSWGAGPPVLHGGRWYLFVTEIAKHCGLSEWTTLSTVIRASSDNMMGLSCAMS